MITLSDGRTLSVDLGVISIREYRRIFDAQSSDAETDGLLARVVGLSEDELTDLPYLDYKRVLWGVLTEARQPVGDPN